MKIFSRAEGANRTRKMLENYILSHPGATISLLKRIFQIPIGSLRYHLDVLERKGIIIHQLINNTKRYYGIGTDKGLSDDQRRLIYLMKIRPGITQKELIKKTRLKRHVVKYNLKKLDEIDIIHVDQKGKEKCYYYMSSSDFKFNKEHLSLIAKYLRKEIDLKTYTALRKKLDKRGGPL